MYSNLFYVKVKENVVANKLHGERYQKKYQPKKLRCAMYVKNQLRTGFGDPKKHWSIFDNWKKDNHEYILENISTVKVSWSHYDIYNDLKKIKKFGKKN